MTHTRRHRREGRHTRRTHGGTIESVTQVITNTPAEPSIHIINPDSKFVVATYWWGKANMNRNLQLPCPEDIMDMARKEVLKEVNKTEPLPSWAVEVGGRLKEIMKVRDLTDAERHLFESLTKVWNDWKTRVLAKEETKALIKVAYDRINAEEQAKPGSRPVRSFPDMIAEWESKCQAANVNYVALNTEFDRSDYQNGINGKPLFIRKILDAVAPRGVLYIDGDMWMHKYPAIFDIDNVDFMARGWNMDPRSKEKSIAKPFYDPYTFETSGGTMYFGNTKRARELLDKWFTESIQPHQHGKADDRILSQIFTTQSFVVNTNIINLPLEYLWLTDLYQGFLKDASSPASIEDVLIEHPYCLTGEERAADQGGAVNRTPDNYEEEVIDNINYKRSPELLYEYIFFDGNEEMRNGFGRYLQYMKSAVGGFTQQPMLQIVDFKDRYGPFNAIADKNLAAIQPSTLPPGQRASLPLTAPIPAILSELFAGHDVELGGSVEADPEDDVAGTDGSSRADGIDMYTRYAQVDITRPLFLSARSKPLMHALVMCDTLADLNERVRSYAFLSRIRWNLTKGGTPEQAPEEEAPVPHKIVHQIWFGGEIPEWRATMFANNKAVCEANGWKYRLWKNEDRTRENFPATIAYQETSLEKGKEIGQNRWAQVADLARLEIVYMHGGIYIDSLVESSPALLKAVASAWNKGADFVCCNEDPCKPELDCVGNEGKMYLANSFFAGTPYCRVLERLLNDGRLDGIDYDSEFLNRTTGPYYLRSGIENAETDQVFVFQSAQIYQFNQQPTPYKEAKPNIFLYRTEVPGSVRVKEGMYFLPGGIHALQTKFLMEQKRQQELLKASQQIAGVVVEGQGPLATYHSGLGGTWST